MRYEPKKMAASAMRADSTLCPTLVLVTNKIVKGKQGDKWEQGDGTNIKIKLSISQLQMQHVF